MPIAKATIGGAFNNGSPGGTTTHHTTTENPYNDAALWDALAKLQDPKAPSASDVLYIRNIANAANNAANKNTLLIKSLEAMKKLGVSPEFSAKIDLLLKSLDQQHATNTEFASAINSNTNSINDIGCGLSGICNTPGVDGDPDEG